MMAVTLIEIDRYCALWENICEEPVFIVQRIDRTYVDRRRRHRTTRLRPVLVWLSKRLQAQRRNGVFNPSRAGDRKRVAAGRGIVCRRGPVDIYVVRSGLRWDGDRYA